MGLSPGEINWVLTCCGKNVCEPNTVVTVNIGLTGRNIHFDAVSMFQGVVLRNPLRDSHGEIMGNHCYVPRIVVHVYKPRRREFEQ